MTATAAHPTQQSGRKPLGELVVRMLTTTDHKLIGKMYLITSFAWFLVGGVMALLIRAELFAPGSQVVNDELYNQLFTMHGTIMLLLFATPLFFGFANVIMPLQIGSPDVAFPRLNMFSYWLFLFGGLIAASGFLTPQGAADFGWFAYTPLSDAVRSPGVGGDLWIMGLWMAGLGSILGAVNFITTIICMRVPGMTMFRMPMFVWNVLITSLLVLIAFPILAGALLMLGGTYLVLRPGLRRILGLDRWLGRLPQGRRLLKLDRALSRVGTSHGALAGALVLSLLNHVCTATAIYGLLGSLGGVGVPVPSWLETLGIMAVANTISAVPLAPAGWGVGEAAFGTLFGLLGFNPTLGVALSVLYRLTATALSLGAGLVLLAPAGRADRTAWLAAAESEEPAAGD